MSEICEIRIFACKGEDMPTIYNRETLIDSLNLLAKLPINEYYKIEIVKFSVNNINIKKNG